MKYLKFLSIIFSYINITNLYLKMVQFPLLISRYSIWHLFMFKAAILNFKMDTDKNNIFFS